MPYRYLFLLKRDKSSRPAYQIIITGPILQWWPTTLHQQVPISTPVAAMLLQYWMTCYYTSACFRDRRGRYVNLYYKLSQRYFTLSITIIFIILEAGKGFSKCVKHWNSAKSEICYVSSTILQSGFFSRYTQEIIKYKSASSLI